MGKIEIQLDEQTAQRIHRLAESRRCSPEQLIKEVIEQLAVAETETDPFLGMLAREPELMDRIVESAMRARQEHPLRHGG